MCVCVCVCVWLTVRRQILFVWVLLQGMLGAVTKAMWTAEFRRTATLPQVKAFPDMVHWWSGKRTGERESVCAYPRARVC